MDHLNTQPEKITKKQRVENAKQSFEQHIKELGQQKKEKKQLLFGELTDIYNGYKENKSQKLERKGAVKDLEKFMDLVKNGEKDETLKKFVELAKEKNSVLKEYTGSKNIPSILFHLAYGRLLENFEKLGESVENRTQAIKAVTDYLVETKEAASLYYQNKIFLEDSILKGLGKYFSKSLEILSADFTTVNFEELVEFPTKVDEYNRTISSLADNINERDGLGIAEEPCQELINYQNTIPNMVGAHLEMEMLLKFCHKELQRYTQANDSKGAEALLKMEKTYLAGLQNDLTRYQTAVEDLFQFINEKTDNKYENVRNTFKEHLNSYQKKLETIIENIDGFLQNMNLFLPIMKSGTMNPTSDIEDPTLEICLVLKEIPRKLQKLPAGALTANYQDIDMF